MKSIETLLLELNALEIKVWDDGGYLGYSTPKGRLTPALREEMLERKVEILTFLQQANQMSTLTLPPIQPGPKDVDPPLSFAQQRLWFLDQLDGQSSPYNEVRAITLTGPLDVTALRQSLLEIIRRHQILQTTFAIRKGTPVQVITPQTAVPLEIIDWQSIPAEEQTVRVQQRAVEEAQHHFDLAQGPLLRIILFQLSADSQVLLVTMHHIITDGWSIGVFVREMSLLYEAFSTGAPSPLPELELQYADFAYWQRQWLRGEALERQLAYWREQLAGVPAVLALPTDRPRPPVQTFRGDSETFQLNPVLTSQLKSLSQRSGATLFVTLLSAFATLLYRYSAQADIVVGSPIANRTRPEIEALMGFFANTLALRLRLHENPSFSALLGQAQQVALDGYAHQDVPFEKLIEVLQPERNLSHSPLFQVMFVFQNTPQEQFRLPGLMLTPLELEHVTAKFDLTLSMAETEQGLRGDLEYNSDLFDPSTIVRMVKYFQTLLAAIVADPEQNIATLPLLTAVERHQLLEEWNNTQVDYPQDQCLQQLFEAQVERTPEATALIFADEQLTYRELNGRANQLAHVLQAAGVGPETLVGLCLERSVEMVVGLLGILKAGGAYLPLDPSYPRERLAFMLADAQVTILLTQQKIVANLPEVSTKLSRSKFHAPRGSVTPERRSQTGLEQPKLDLLKLICLDSYWTAIALESEQNPSSGVTPENLAYVIYTSGSTGQPKGAMNTHRGIVNRLLWMQDAYRLTPADRVLQKTPFSFDVSVWEFFWPLLTGAGLVVAKPEGHQDSAYLVELIAEQKITTLHFVPSMLQVFLEEQNLDRCQSLRQVICSGEALPFDLQNRFFARLDADLHNLYGPTEAAVDVTAWQCQRDSQQQFVPIGRPIANTQTYILDAQLQPVPPGISGELHLGGIALARGYLNRPDLTAEKFVPNPFIQSRGAGEQGGRGELSSAPLPPAPLRLYKTGDLACYLPDGNIEYLGRLDHQVKIRGFRIELGEIEATLTQHPAIRESVVVTWSEPNGHVNGSSGPRLVAYVVPHGEQPPEMQDLRHFLKEKLPDYMVPTSFVVLAELPLSPNGKLDRRALPAPDLTQRDLKAAFAPPRSQTEALLAKLWHEVLGGVPVGIYDNFFELGGHSLLATQLMFRLRDTFQVELPLRRLFEEPTVAGLAALIETTLRQNGPSDQVGTGLLPQVVPDPVQRYQPFPLTDVQQAYWLGRSGIFELGNVSTHNYFELEGSGIDLEQAGRAWQRLIAQHDMLRVVILADGQQQVLEQVPPYQIEVLDLRGLDDKSVAAQLESVRQKMSHQVLPAEQWPLFQIRATRLADKRVRLHLSIDALMTDGWSVFTLSRDWFQLYLNPEQALSPLELTFRDYVLAEQKLQETELVRRSETYWFNRLDSLAPAPELPLAQRPGDLIQPRFKRRSDQLDPTAWQRLKQRASQAGLTASGVLLAAFAEILTAWSKSPRFTINLTLFNRLPLHPQVNDIVGDFTSLTLLEVDNSTAESFSSRAQRLQQQLWQDLDHRYVGGVRVLRELARRQGGQPVAMPIVFTSTLGQDVPTRNPHGELIYHISQTPQIWLDHQILEQDGKLVINWDALEDILPEGLWDEMFAAFFDLLRRLVNTEATWTEPTRQLLPSAQLAQRAKINDTATSVTDDLLHTLFITQALARPAQPAIITPNRCLSYQELFDRANHLSAHLQELDAQPNTLIAVVMEKGWEQVVAVLGILMSGAAYLPIDPDLPSERRHYLLNQGQVKLALTQPWLNHSLDWPDTLHRLIINDIKLPSSILHPPSSILHPPSSSHLAYVIYTSGSTGLPKGVMIDHRGAVNTILDLNERFGVTSHERVLALSALSFDLSVFDIFGTLAAGGTIVMPQATKDPAHWADLCRQHQVSLWNSVPALMQMLVEYLDGDRLPSPLRLVMLSGDWIPVTLPDQIKHLWPQAELYSLGGATEASIWSIFYPIHQVEPTWTSIPYGKPLHNQSFHVLNHLLEPCPVWVPGELYIGGIGLAQGYWRDEIKTSERFITHPQTGERLYKTGDLGRYLPDGNIEFLGREDFQVKIRGYRIELGEIEAALQQHPAVSEAVVMAAGQSRNHQHLVAYIVPEPSKSPGRFSEAYLPSADNGVIQDPLERAEFSLKQPGLRAAEPAQAIILLPKPEFDEPLTQAYLARQSYRHFLSEPIPLEEFSRFLSCLLQLSLPDSLLPKYRYPSAGNLYPVQAYLYIKPNRVEGLSSGCYYYQPAGHELILLQANSAPKDVASGANQAIFDQGAFWLFLVGELAAITPLYGDRARDFCLLEAGYMGQLLMHEAPGHHLGLCPIGYLDFDELQTLFGLASSQVLLHTFVGGGIASLQTNGGVPSASSQAALSLEAQLRAYLPQKLPDYMLPTTYILLETLPLTANGKVDRRALPAPQAGLPAAETGFVPPQTATEKILAGIWADILALEKVGIYDNFFEQGGNSLLATRLVARLRQTFPVDLPLRTFFESPTVAGIAQAIDTLVQAKLPSGPFEHKAQRLPAHLIALRSEGTKPPLFLVHPLAGLIFPYYELAGLLGDDQPVYGFQSVGLAGEAEPIAQIETMAGHYLEALRLVQPEGPYFLAGWSLGGVIALELAQQLRRLGQTVALLAVIEPSPLVTPHKISAFFEASRYFFSLMGPRFWPYIHDYFSLLMAGGGQNRQIAPGSEAGASRGSYGQPELARLWQIVRANVQASHHYVPQIYPGRINLFQTGVSAEKNESNPKAGRWQQLAAEGFELHHLPGHHLNVLRQPYVKELADQLTACLAQARNGWPER